MLEAQIVGCEIVPPRTPPQLLRCSGRTSDRRARRLSGPGNLPHVVRHLVLEDVGEHRASGDAVEQSGWPPECENKVVVLVDSGLWSS